MRHDMFMHSLKLRRLVICDKYWLSKEASKVHVNETRVYAYEIELWIQIDKEDFMHDINQREFKMDG